VADDQKAVGVSGVDGELPQRASEQVLPEPHRHLCIDARLVVRLLEREHLEPLRRQGGRRYACFLSL
jgi:hypothetical protein